MALPRGRVGDLSGNQKKTTKENDLQKAVITIRHECVCVCVHVHVHVHAQLLSHPEGMAMLQVWSLVGRWHSQCGVSGPKLDDLPLVCGAHKGARFPPARPCARQIVLTLPN